MCAQCFQALSFRLPQGSSIRRSTIICAPGKYTRKLNTTCARGRGKPDKGNKSQGPQPFHVLVITNFGERSRCDVDCRCRDSWHKGRRNATNTTIRSPRTCVVHPSGSSELTGGAETSQCDVLPACAATRSQNRRNDRRKIRLPRQRVGDDAATPSGRPNRNPRTPRATEREGLWLATLKVLLQFQAVPESSGRQPQHPSGSQQPCLCALIHNDEKDLWNPEVPELRTECKDAETCNLLIELSARGRGVSCGHATRMITL